MSAHTPGPWLFERAHPEDGFGAERTGFRILEEDRRIIAEIIEPDADFISEANARLIARAPEMHAFIALLARMPPDGGGDSVMENDDAVSALSTLIDQARELLVVSHPSPD